MAVEDDHLPFVERGVPSIDVIDLDYGPNNSYHHTAQDTMDKISAHSLTIDGDVFMETHSADRSEMSLQLSAVSFQPVLAESASEDGSWTVTLKADS